MRVEYDRIQQRMKDQLKRPTPFDRIKKFFGKNKSKRKNFCFATHQYIYTNLNLYYYILNYY